MANKKRTFDLEVEAHRLFQEARARGDATGAASVLRLLKDLSIKTEAPNDSAKAANSALIDAMTDDEKQHMRALLAEIRTIKTAVRVRLGLEQPAVEEPEPPVAVIEPPPTPAPTPVGEPVIDELEEAGPIPLRRNLYVAAGLTEITPGQWTHFDGDAMAQQIMAGEVSFAEARAAADARAASSVSLGWAIDTEQARKV